MKSKFKFLSLFLILALLCIPVLASCGTSETDITIEEEITTDAEEITTAAEETTTTVADAEGDDATPTVTEFAVTFTLDEHVTVTVYQTQTDMTNGENGETTTTAYARDKTSGAILTDGEGQVNFLLTFDEGYELDAITVESADNYNNLKGSSDTGVTNGYRITKITGDLTVTVTSKSTEAAENLTLGYTVTFSVGEHVSLTVFPTQDMTAGGTENATVAYSRIGSTGTLTRDGTGQVNFLLTFDEGYELDAITIDKEAGAGYTSLKGSSDTGVSNGYRITKITDDLTVTVTAKVIETETAADLEAAYSATFVLGEHVSVVVYKTQADLLNGTNGEENTTVAYARNADDGKLLTDGNGQINFLLVFDEGYELDSLTVTAGTYNKIKNPAESTVENSIRITKITADTIVTITTKATA